MRHPLLRERATPHKARDTALTISKSRSHFLTRTSIQATLTRCFFIE